MATEVVRQLSINITTTNTWTQLKAAGSNYAVPVAGRGVAKSLSAINLDVTSATVEFGISVNSTIDDVEKVWPPIAVQPGYSIQDQHNVTHAMEASQAVWARAVGTTPNVTFRADVLEIT